MELTELETENQENSCVKGVKECKEVKKIETWSTVPNDRIKDASAS